MEKNKHLRFFLTLAVVFHTIIFLFTSCSSNKPIRIGFIGGTTGRVADLGLSGRDAVQMAIESVNTNGGIHGRQIQLIVTDDQQNPDKARQVVEELIKEQVDAIIGPMTSDMAMVVAPLINAAKIVTVSPTASTAKLSGQDDYFFKISTSTRQNGAKSGAYHAQAGKMHRLAVLHDLGNQAYSESWLKNFTRPFLERKGNEIVGVIGFDTRRGITFTKVVNKAFALNPDGILIIANSMDSALICQQVRKINSRVHLTLADWGATERLLELGGKAVEGVTVIQVFDRKSKKPRYLAFREKYIERFKQEPGFAGVLGYDAATVVINALQYQKKGQSLKDVLLETEFEGLQAVINFDTFGDRGQTTATMGIISHQKFMSLE
ncbi:ABC transporter substrate-binding protein [Desulfogranum marinum]|uniref:ABC transporter substrate-binding protein n=1 Tax=Desulfogranum marinum TaxID=453220 RepID=UPI001963F4E8|nr:ABC transporter substrate-binding protein [Desulfogranum marinum]MBM9511121.1 ABC transporter substrate-binding protein [Desulfogranum marinum]